MHVGAILEVMSASGELEGVGSGLGEQEGQDSNGLETWLLQNSHFHKPVFSRIFEKVGLPPPPIGLTLVATVVVMAFALTV